jgi:lysophospholipid acyltransferase (LPLAT)-like uncharacterized protein
MKDGFLYRVSLNVVPTIFVWLTRIWFSTCRVKVHGQMYRDQINASQVPAIGSCWHYTVLYILYFMRNESGVAMVSASKDGEYISRVANKLGWVTVRGSRKKGGLQAIKSMIRHIREGKNAAIIADGSQGPARVVQAGCIVLSSRTGEPILPIIWSCNRYKRFRSWDGTALPLPFSKIEFFYGEPLVVPGKIKSDEIEKYRVILENRMNELYDKAWKIQGKIEH